jgi:membrane-associated phospholipid phosphatase
MVSPRVATTAWLAMLAIVNVTLFVLVAALSLGTIRGQMLDTIALAGNDIGQARVADPLNTALNFISVGSLILVLILVGAIALARKRYSLAIMAVVLVAGSAATTYVLKYYLITRLDYGVDPERAFAPNSLPSGHATAAAAFAVGLVLVVPPAVRGVTSLIGATYAGVVGVATLSSGWHRPSDVIASYLIVGGWAAVAGLMLVIAQRPSAVVSRRDRAGWSFGAALVGGLILVVAGIATLYYVFGRMTTPIEEMEVSLLSMGYLGSALLIGGAGYLMMACVLVTIHRVVPHSKDGNRSISGPRLEPALVARTTDAG